MEQNPYRNVEKDKSDISSAAFSEKGDLVITLSDGTKINVGKAVGASGKDGKDGKDGIGIKSAKSMIRASLSFPIQTATA